MGIEIDSTTKRCCSVAEGIGAFESLNRFGNSWIHYTDDKGPISEINGDAILQKIYTPALGIALDTRPPYAQARLVIGSKKLLYDHSWLIFQGILNGFQTLNLWSHHCHRSSPCNLLMFQFDGFERWGSG